MQEHDGRTFTSIGIAHFAVEDAHAPPWVRIARERAGG
jgi:hypothetical protein